MILKSGSLSEKNRKQEVAIVAHARQSCIEYIKRCCSTYLHERIRRIKHLRWKHGGHIPEKTKVSYRNVLVHPLRTSDSFTNYYSDDIVLLRFL